MPRMPLLAFSLALSLAACGDKNDDDTGGISDGGATDGGGSDGGSADGGTTDGGTSDGGTSDGGTTEDGGGDDGGTEDKGIAEEIIHDLSWRLHDDIESMAYVSWTQDAEATVHVEFSFDTGDWESTPSFTAGDGRQEQLVVGIPYGYTAEWKVVVEEDDSQVDGSTITVGDWPSGLPEGDVLVANALSWLSSGKYLLTSINQNTGGWTGGTYWTMIIDRQARPVWAHKAPSSHWTLFVQVAQSGDHFLWDEATYWADWDEGAGSSVHFAYLDEEIKEVSTPGLHHAFVQLPDGTLVWGSQHHGGGEALAEKAPDAEEETTFWNAVDDWPGVSGCESNGLFYDVKTDSFLYSFYTNNSIVAVDHSTGESMWWAGDVGRGYQFDPPDSEYEWQHGISYTEDRTLLVSTEARVSGSYSTMVREYEVDHDGETLHEIWNYDPEVYASTNGDAWRLSNGNTLHTVGSAGHVFEVDSSGTPVWHVDYDGSHLMGRSEYINDLYTLVKPRE